VECRVLYLELWHKAIGYREVVEIRKFETKDMVKRLGTLPPIKVFINNHPIANPVAIFNPSFIVKSGDIAEIYARIIVGYYLYVSAITRMEVPLSDILEGAISINYYSSELAVYPSTRYDIWGCEDPRVYALNGKIYMTYAGRNVNYFQKPAAPESVLPITATPENNHRYWSKQYVHVLKDEERKWVVHDKDAFMARLAGRLLLFHRPRLVTNTYHLAVSEVVLPSKCESTPCKAVSENTIEVMPPASFESKLGWAVPITISSSRAVLLVHGVDRDIGAYRVLGVELTYAGDGVVVNAVTPFYIMEPRTPYELYGDRPFTVFPAGAQIVDGNVVISYGAADYMIGFGLVDFSELMSALDRGRLY
ncbi:MAG: glycosidase, partial [Desulfurococcaceae archaeon]